MLIIVRLNIPTGDAAARVSVEYHDRNILSTNCCIDQVPVVKIRGKAITRTCR